MLKLQPYTAGGKQKQRCPACGKQKTYVRYMNDETGQYLPYEYGRCERINTCGYHKKPERELYSNQENTNSARLKFVDPAIVRQTFREWQNNPFACWLVGRVGFTEAHKAMLRYHVGTARNSGTIFWYMNADGKYCNGKKIFYLATGMRHRGSSPCYTHLTANGFRICLFGEHLLPQEPQKPIAIVESEKTAVVASICYPENVWLASGSNNGLTEEKMRALPRRQQINLFPDCDQAGREAFAKAKEKLEAMGYVVELHDIAPEKTDGTDLADMIFALPNPKNLILNAHNYPVEWDW